MISIIKFKNKYGISDLYAWTLSKEGQKLIESLKRDFEIRCISRV
jgi:hypothetical protein